MAATLQVLYRMREEQREEENELKIMKRK